MILYSIREFFIFYYIKVKRYQYKKFSYHILIYNMNIPFFSFFFNFLTLPLVLRVFYVILLLLLILLCFKILLSCIITSNKSIIYSPANVLFILKILLHNSINPKLIYQC